MSDYVFNFDKKYKGLLKKKSKTSTIRLDSKPVSINDVVPFKFVGGDSPVFGGLLKITRIKIKPFGLLNQRDAYYDGYNSLNDLKEDLTRFYGNISDDVLCYTYHFEVL